MYGFDSLPAGRYAITGKDGESVRFFRVDVPGGKWGNHRFLKEMHSAGQAGFNAYPVRDKDFARKVLTYLSRSPEEHLRAFGRKLGVCGRCGLALTDDESRAAGIGPVCVNKI